NMHDLVDTVRVFRLSSDATIRTPILIMRGARSMLDDVALLIDFQTSGCAPQPGISILKPTLVIVGTTQHGSAYLLKIGRLRGIDSRDYRRRRVPLHSFNCLAF